jgi:uncharacterized protein YigE (DUF2233 family)
MRAALALSAAHHTGTRVKRHSAQAKHEKVVALAPQTYIDQLKKRSLNLREGITYRNVKGPLTINLIDVDLRKPDIKIRPILAGNSFSQLRDVTDHARDAHAIAAVNANYFKKNGVPLGTLIVDGEWVAGPIYDRVSMGITADGKVAVDRVKFGGVLETDNHDVPSLWINTVNQPHRTGVHLIAYTRRWGSLVHLDYPGCLVALDAAGRVTSKSTQDMIVPPGGMVLADSRTSTISKLKEGDTTKLRWQTTPDNWQQVVQAVSGGPLLLKDGKLYVDCKDERFSKAWTGSQIKARTAAAVTADQHLLLVTVEGPHTLWDMAKFLQKLGATDALNLDGGGSTTMVVNGLAVTRAPKSAERRVASALGVFVEPVKKSDNQSPALPIASQAVRPADPPISTDAKNSETQPAPAIARPPFSGALITSPSSEQTSAE